MKVTLQDSKMRNDYEEDTDTHSTSSESGKSEFDAEYYKLKPPATPVGDKKTVTTKIKTGQYTDLSEDLNNKIPAHKPISQNNGHASSYVASSTVYNSNSNKHLLQHNNQASRPATIGSSAFHNSTRVQQDSFLNGKDNNKGAANTNQTKNSLKSNPKHKSVDTISSIVNTNLSPVPYKITTKTRPSFDRLTDATGAFQQPNIQTYLDTNVRIHTRLVDHDRDHGVTRTQHTIVPRQGTRNVITRQPAPAIITQHNESVDDSSDNLLLESTNDDCCRDCCTQFCAFITCAK